MIGGVLPAPLGGLDRPLEAVRRFTPQWFSVTMGTGVMSGLLTHLGGVAASIGCALWIANMALFALFASLYAARWALFPQEAARILRHPTASMFFGAAPMGLATIVNGWIAFGPGLVGPAALAIAVGLWWLDVGLALICGAAVPYLMFTRQDHSLPGMTALWLLPVVAGEVAAASGGLLAPHLSGDAALAALTVSYGLWAFSVPVAFAILTILILRLALHKLPPSDMAATSWLALGPIGTGAFGLLTLGAAAPAVLTAHGLADIGVVAHGLGVVGGLALAGFGVWWLALAALMTLRYRRAGAAFNLGWWGFIFPPGAYALALFALGQALAMPAFTWIGAAITLTLVVVWTRVAARTLAGAWRGDLFVSPCLVMADEA